MTEEGDFSTVFEAGTELRKWADDAQYVSAPMQAGGKERGMIVPRVHLLWMTPDPLGAIAAMARMYKGIPTYDLSEITNQERREFFADVQKTHLRAPLEAVKMHFFIEGVTRSFTHQLVRQRTAVYAQESLRFAVKEHILDEVSIPPSLAGTTPLDPYEGDPERLPPRTKEQRWRNRWDKTVMEIEEAYHYLVNDGMPAEDARGLLPHAITTRANYSTDLRNMVDHAGNRLCTQAQFEWRVVFLGIVQAIMNYGQQDPEWNYEQMWQYEAIATSDLFRPVCYALNRCPFQASFDRACTIRQRVEMFARHGIPSSQWHDKDKVTNGIPIRTAEWMMDPAAARSTSGGGGHE